MCRAVLAFPASISCSLAEPSIFATTTVGTDAKRFPCREGEERYQKTQ